MKVPRDLTGRELIAALSKLGYSVTRQSGSHIRITTERSGTHHLTIPDHRPIKVGTLASIMRDLEQHHGMNRFELTRFLFG
ncbi:MAG: type II toxin-antitoxin system HicA family toxin [Flavobacteriales bacterium]